MASRQDWEMQRKIFDSNATEQIALGTRQGNLNNFKVYNINILQE